MGLSEEASFPVTGLKFFEPLRAYFDRLHQVKAHPNRNLHLDEYLCLLLLAYFNPAIKSLRQLVKLPAYPLMEGNAGLHRTSLASFSEASSVFDPEPLRRIFLDLAGEAKALDAGPRRPESVPEALRVIAADATLFRLLPRITPDFYRGRDGQRTSARRPALKAHVLFSVFDQVPVGAEFSGDAVDERHVLPLQIGGGALFVLDRGYQSLSLYREILDTDNSLVARIRKDTGFEVLAEAPLSDAARAAGVSADQHVRLATKRDRIERPLRVVRARVVCAPPKNLDPKHKRGKHAAPTQAPTSHELILLTDRLDLAAEEILAIYDLRWQIEIFFRWFKCVLQCQHLFSESPNGMALQMYTALIASLLVVIHTRRKPTKMLLFMLQMYLQGVARWEHVQEEIDKLKPVVD